MVNKQNLWFVTLFSLILVLSVFYITMPGEELLAPAGNTEERETLPTVQVKESEKITALRVERNDERTAAITKLQATINDNEASAEDKDNAIARLRRLNEAKAKEEQLEKILEEEHNEPAFVHISGRDVRVVIEIPKHDVKLANSVMRLVQKEFENRVNVSVRFEA